MAKAVKELTFDMTRVTAGEIAALQKALRIADTETAANIYAKTITQCPSEWGTPDDPQTYLNLPYFGEFQDIVDAWFEAGKNARAILRTNSGNI
jgi:hypothetical protein